MVLLFIGFQANKTQNNIIFFKMDEMSIGLIDFLLKEQPAKLYSHSAACLAVFRELSPLAQNFILRLLFVDQAIPQAVIASWVKSEK